MRGASNKKHIGRRKKKTLRHQKGAKTTPTMKEQERWDDITGAYGNLPGVEPVRSTQMDGAASDMRRQQQQQMEQQQMEQMGQESPQGANQNLIVNDDDNNLVTTNNDDKNESVDDQPKEAVDLDSLVGRERKRKERKRD